MLGSSQYFWGPVFETSGNPQEPKAASCPGALLALGKPHCGVRAEQVNTHKTLTADPAAPQVLQQQVQSSISKVTTLALLPPIPSSTSPCSPSHPLPLAAVPSSPGASATSVTSTQQNHL